MIVMNELVAGMNASPSRGLSGVIERGSMTAIVGANGCGKSTLLKTLAGFIPPSAALSLAGKRPVIGWLAQRHALEAQFPLTVQDVVSMGCWPGISLFPGFVAKRGCALPARLSGSGWSRWRYPPLMNSPAASFSACCLPASWCSRRRW
jgi:zinc/manganese transport system ATP-binding protein